MVGLSLWIAVRPAAAWVETRLVTDDITLEIDPAAFAVVEHRITMRVHGGPLKAFDLASADKDVTPLESTVVALGNDGSSSAGIPLEIVPRAAGGLRVNVTAPRGLSRGTFLFRVRYRRALVAGEDVRRDGAMLRVRWTGASWPEGRDNVRCTVVLPAAPTEPRAPTTPERSDQGAATDGADGVFISETRRGADHDEITLIRPHVARSEPVTWTLYVDPRALGQVNDPGLRPTPPAPPRVEAPPQQRAAYVVGAAILLFGFSLLVGIKWAQVARHFRGVAEPRALVPLPVSLRVLLAGPVLAAGVAMQLNLDDPWWGTVAVLFALLLAAHRRPISPRVPRGPGQWLLLADTEAFGDPPSPRGAWLDAGTTGGRVLFGLALTVAAVATYFVGRASAYHAYLVVFDSAVLFPIFGTGRLADLPPEPLRGLGTRLGRMARLLRAHKGVRAVAWARLPNGATAFDELRLLCTPKVPLRGFVGVEVGLVPVAGAGGYLPLPEILVRVIDASPCHDAFRALRPGSRWVRGRRAEERVMSVIPRLPTLAMTTALALKLLERARDIAPPSVTVRPAKAGPPSPKVARPGAVQRAAGRSAPNSVNAGKTVTRSAGSGECASSAGTTASPLQPT
jgi:hypothetical protein